MATVSYIQSRDASTSKEKHMFMAEAYKVIYDDTMYGNEIEKSMVLQHPIDWRLDGHQTPFLVKSTLRHHMQQFYYLHNLTVLQCSKPGSFRNNIIAQHGSCQEAESKFLRFANSYRDAIAFSSARNVIFEGNDERKNDIDTLGLRYGVDRDERDERDMVFIEPGLLKGIADSMFRHVHTYHNIGTVPNGVFNKANPSWARINADWIGPNRPSVLVIDNVFTAEGLNALQEFTTQQTMWHTGKVEILKCIKMKYSACSFYLLIPYSNFLTTGYRCLVTCVRS